MGDDANTVMVLDRERHFLDYIHPAWARQLLRDKMAVIWSKAPFSIRLLVDGVPTQHRRHDMAVPVITNFTEYFKQERDIYVQNISGMQVSLTFEVGNRVQSHLFDTGNAPVNLTQYVPFQSIKSSMDFRKMVMRKPPILKILTEDEYKRHYENMAVSEGLITKETNDEGAEVEVPDVQAAMDIAEKQRLRTLNHEPLPIEQTRTMTANVESEPVPPRGGPIMVEDVINPRVLHLCNQVKNEIPENERMPAAELIAGLKGVHNLTMDDLEYVRAHGSYASVRKWAKTQMEALSVQLESTSAS